MTLVRAIDPDHEDEVGLLWGKGRMCLELGWFICGLLGISLPNFDGKGTNKIGTM